MKKLVIAMTAAGLFTTLIPGLAQANELDDMKLSLQKLQERIAQLEAQPKAAPSPASNAPVLSASSLGANASVTVYGKLDLFTEYDTGGGKGDRTSL